MSLNWCFTNYLWPGMHCKAGTSYPQVMAVDEEKLAEELRQEGFRHTHVWQDGPNAFYAEQVHNQETAHIILSGELTLIMNDEARITLLESVATFRGELHTPREWERADVAT